MLNKNLPITIASGHAGNYGASGCGYREEVLTKELVALICNKFKSLGYNIIDVSPKGNYGASEQLKAEYTNANAIVNAQLHICVHFNASNGQGHGTETWIYALGNSANKYASVMNNAVCNVLGTTNRGVKASGNSLCIPRRVNAPTILLETVFIDNQSDMDKYIGKKVQVANAIVEALTGEIISSDKSETPVVTTPTQSQYEKAKVYNSARCKELQEKLIKLGYNCGGYGADGIFGQGTYDSLIQFQKDNGLVVDGLAGINTFTKLNELIAKKSSNSGDDWVRRLQEECNRQGFSNQKADGIAGVNTLNGCPTLKQGARGNITKLLQERLVSLGYNTNGVDGVFGGGTKSAVINYQKAKGLSADGIVGVNTWRKLLRL